MSWGGDSLGTTGPRETPPRTLGVVVLVLTLVGYGGYAALHALGVLRVTVEGLLAVGAIGGIGLAIYVWGLWKAHLDAVYRAGPPLDGADDHDDESPGTEFEDE